MIKIIGAHKLEPKQDRRYVMRYIVQTEDTKKTSWIVLETIGNKLIVICETPIRFKGKWYFDIRDMVKYRFLRDIHGLGK
jgi:hypothetical protein